MASKAAGSKAATPEQQVKELARKDFNKKCFDCGRGGPQQNVNLTVHTFVCTACSGLLRNFNHQLKTINMYSFKPQEVAALEEGGNKKARKYWLHFYDAENPREFRPDMDDPKQVLEFMKLMYDQKKWCIEQPKKEEPKKEKKKKKKEGGGEAADDDSGRKAAAAEGEPSKERQQQQHDRRASFDSDSFKLKEPVKEGAGEKRSRRSAGSSSASAEGQPQQKAAASSAANAGGLDFLSSLSDLSFSSPPAASSGGFGSSSGGFGNDDFGSSSGGFGAAAGGGFNADFDAGFSSSASSSAAVNGHPAFSVPASQSGSGSSGGGGGLSSLVEQAQAVKVSPQAVAALVHQIRSISSQHHLDSQHSQALVLQALGKVASEPQQAVAGKGVNGRAGDAFADLPLPQDDGPGHEPDSGNPFGSDEDDEQPAARAQQQQQQPQLQQSFHQPQPGFGAPPLQAQGGFGFPHSGFGAPHGFGGAHPGGFGAAGGFGAPGGGFGMPQQQMGGGQPQQQMQMMPQQQQQHKQPNPLFDQFNPF